MTESANNIEMRLAQTISWCSKRVLLSDPKNCLRSPDLRPGILEESRFSAMERVANSRWLLGGPEVRDVQLPTDLHGGRLLIYYPDCNLSCGTAEEETQKFFDVDNVPPWDTWVAYCERGDASAYSSCLVSWVPPPFIELASRGIEVNPEECIVWATKEELGRFISEGLRVSLSF